MNISGSGYIGEIWGKSVGETSMDPLKFVLSYSNWDGMMYSGVVDLSNYFELFYFSALIEEINVYKLGYYIVLSG